MSIKSIPIPRISTLDLMRGCFLIALIIDHLQYWPSGYDFLTMRGELFVSAAEGFFLISGIVLGIVRGRKLIEKPFEAGAKLLLRRGVQLYITYIIVAIGSTLIGWSFLANPGLKDGIADPSTSIAGLLWQTLSLQYIYGWADYLRLYALFLFVAPIFLWLLRKNLWWIGLGVSVAIWALTPDMLYPTSLSLQPLHWQLLFFGGMTIGFHWPELTAYWSSLSKLTKRATISLLLITMITTLCINIFLAFGGMISTEIYTLVGPLRDSLQQGQFNKENLPLSRVALFLVWFWASFWIFTKFRPIIERYAGWILLPFGTNSLYVYSVHAIIIFFLHLILAPKNDVFIVNFIVTTIVLAAIWLMLRYKILFKIIPR